MRYLSFLAGCIAFAGFAHGDGAVDSTIGPSIDGSTRTFQPRGWLIQETARFRISCRASLAVSKRLPEACEALRRQLQETWFGEASGDWSPKCEIVVHPTVSEYIRELGPGSRQTSGCATVEVEGG